MTTTFCQSGAVLAKAGEKVNSGISGGILITAGGDHYIEQWINQAESLINATCRYNFLTNYSTLISGAKLILEEVASNLAAIYAIQYDMSKYTSRVEAEDMVNILRDAALRGLAILRDKKTQKFITDPTSGSV